MKPNTLFAAITIVLMSLFINGCNTMEGAGQDVQKAGQKMEESANEAK